MIFLTVGTQFPFDRLVRAVDNFFDAYELGDEVFAQIGDTTYKPRHFEAVATLDKEMFDRRFHEASAIIGHAGMGTIMLALDSGKPLLAMPRRKRNMPRLSTTTRWLWRTNLRLWGTFWSPIRR
jgi:UDP-N-acetylglucosamine transferase subunit ALG13